ncbi:MAG: carboxypeptidase M32 [Promethearchaeota archaeon]|nr:MAG: carboxypeptidase M32 [Candidatus Lokiarchaeota archaeon]
MNAMKDLWDYFNEIMRLRYINALLDWDQQVNMPKGSVKGRAEQTALMQRLIHSRTKSDKTAHLIKDAEKQNNLSEIDLAMIREAKREYDQATKIPDKLVEDIAITGSVGNIEWEKAREKSDFSIFQPYLEKMINLQIELAERLDTGPTLYSTLIDLFEPGATYDWVSKVFNNLRPKLVKIVNKFEGSSDKPNQSILKKYYDPEKQWKLSIEIIKKLDFDFNTGRQDKSTHPFTTSLSSIDTRFTTRIWENFLPACIFGTIHECGHALYQMGFKEEIHDTYLAEGSSAGFHESQSRMWENIVGRSKEFWTYWFPIFQEYFPENLRDYPMEEFYRSINVVQPSFIRVEADEVTYGLHIILRFELEKMMVEDNLQASELPGLWNEKMENLLGITPPNDAEGVLQDIHWSGASFGYFPTYALGNLYAAQIYNSALKINPSLPEDYKKGEFSNLLNYLKENVHQYGKIYQVTDLLKKITGEDLNPDYFIKYIEEKFYPIYGF